MCPAGGRVRSTEDETKQTNQPCTPVGGIDAETLAAIRSALQSRNEQLLGQLERGSLGDAEYLPSYDEHLGGSDDPAELVFDIFERERNQSITQTLHNLIRQNQEALERIASGSYGKCARCRHQISPERLKAMPSARMCVPCQAASDRRNEHRLASARGEPVSLWS